jgi:hypothetical protein
MNTYSLPPEYCETCDNKIADVFYDAATDTGMWASMCPHCFNFGPGLARLGTGKGQEYTKRTDGKYYKSGG